MVPDPDPARSSEVDYRHPSKLTAAEQMCSDYHVDDFGDEIEVPQMYNHDKCGTLAKADPTDTKSEVRPEGKQQGELSANDTVIM